MASFIHLGWLLFNVENNFKSRRTYLFAIRWNSPKIGMIRHAKGHQVLPNNSQIKQIFCKLSNQSNDRYHHLSCYLSDNSKKVINSQRIF